MARRTLVALMLVALAATACGSDDGGGSDAKGDAIVFDDVSVPAAEFVDELQVIADNDELAAVLKKDDTILVPKSGTIDPLMSQTWVYSRINHIIADREFRRRKLEVTPADRRRARRRLNEIFRAKKAFDAFPQDFQDLLIGRQARMDVFEDTLPKEYEPTEAELQELYQRVGQTCQQGKLISQIYVDTKQEADAVAAELAQGADFATLAQQRSTDTTTKDRGGLTMCIGAQRWIASVEAVQQAALATPVGGTSAPIRTHDGYTVLRVLPLTFENARPLVIDDWHGKHPSALFDFLRHARDVGETKIQPRFAGIQRTEGGVAYTPPTEPPRLD
jgi:hypothetical protein